MKIKLTSEVKGHYKDVFRSFDRKLFEFLLPRGAKVLRFDGSARGDCVHLKFTFPMTAEWVSEIVEDGIRDDCCYFVDEGVHVPLGIKTWRHKHIVHNKGKNAVIEDDIEFSTGDVIFDYLLYPILYLAFVPRVNMYKKYFDQA